MAAPTGALLKLKNSDCVGMSASVAWTVKPFEPILTAAGNAHFVRFV